MRSSKTSLLVVLMFVVALAAGAVAGKLATWGGTTGSLDDLHLSQAQRDQMRQIWESVQQTADDCRKDAEAAQNAQRDQLIALLNDEQKAKYAQLTSATSVRIMELNEKRKTAVKHAIARTEALLSEGQRKEYRKIIENGGRADAPRLGDRPGTALMG
jgi:Spy/CpxP family protein refolding chaperone